jgi:hypothetical protein
MSRTPIRLAAGAAALAAGTVFPGLAGAAPRSATVTPPNPGNYTLVTKNFPAPAGTADGGYVKCPIGQRAVTGGVFFSTSAGVDETTTFAHIADSTITTDGKGWYGAGVNNTNGRLRVTVSAQCLPSTELKGAATVTQDFTSAPGTTTEGGYVSCPSGMRTLSGGGFLHVPGAAPDPGNAHHTLSSSTATFDGLGWYADGRWAGIGQPAQTLTVVVRCLPAAALSASTLVTQDLTVPGGNGASSTYLHCPAGTRVYTGGAFWHKAGSAPDPALARADWASGNTATFDALGWYARGVNGWGNPSSSLVLTLDAHCLPTQ